MIVHISSIFCIVCVSVCLSVCLCVCLWDVMAYRGWRVAENPTVSGSGKTGHRRKGPHQSAKGIVLESSYRQFCTSALLQCHVYVYNHV